MFTAFLSYRRSDTKHIAGHLYDRLVDLNGQDRAFLDVDDIPAGVDFRSHIERQIAAADVLLAIIGPAWLETRHHRDADVRRRLDDQVDPVRLEIGTALRKGVIIIPVLIDGARMPSPEDLPVDIRPLAYVQAVPLNSGRDFRVHFERLVREIESALQRKRDEVEHARPLGSRAQADGAREIAELRDEREKLHRAIEDLKAKTRCPACGTNDPERCVVCNRCFVCLGESPGWWNSFVFRSGHQCNQCLSHSDTYGAS